MAQEVLVVPRLKLAKFYAKRCFYHDEESLRIAKQIVRKYGRFVNRDFAEVSDTVTQIVAVGVVRCGNRVLCLKRAKKSNRRALQLRWTVMIGGHVDDADRQSNDPALSCLNRELDEEIGITPKVPPQLAGLVADPENPVGRLHIGFVFDVQVESPMIQIKSKFDNAEFTYANRNKYYEFMHEKTITGLMKEFDPWSYVFLFSDYPVSRYNWQNISKHSNELPLAW